MYLTIIIFTVIASTNAQVLKWTHTYSYLGSYRYNLLQNLYRNIPIALRKFPLDNFFSGLVCGKWQTFWSSTGKLDILYSLNFWKSLKWLSTDITLWWNHIYFRNSINTMMNTWRIEDLYAPEEQRKNGNPWLL